MRASWATCRRRRGVAVEVERGCARRADLVVPLSTLIFFFFFAIEDQGCRTLFFFPLLFGDNKNVMMMLLVRVSEGARAPPM